jgi:A/G-specific adenine glycosylase
MPSPATANALAGLASRPEDLASRLLDWYGRHARRLPWRAAPGESPDPYRVWLSEIMLQQTTVAAVGPYFEAFLRRWPDVRALAAAPLEEVLAAWAGLGYYARARNLHACAQRLCERHAGRFPEEEAELRRLPGVGPYTAAAVSAIAFGRRAVVVDGNVERVVARLFAVTEPLPGVKGRLRALTESLLPSGAPCGFPYGDLAQAMMDLGATVCVPGQPRCGLCPLAETCQARALGTASELPRRAAKAQRPLRRGVVFWLTRDDGAVLLRRRPPRGLLGGMLELPGTDWRSEPFADREIAARAPARLSWTTLPGTVRHTFTHFHLELSIWSGRLAGDVGALDGQWVAAADLAAAGLPSVMRKAVGHALSATEGATSATR